MDKLALLFGFLSGFALGVVTILWLKYAKRQEPDDEFIDDSDLEEGYAVEGSVHPDYLSTIAEEPWY